MKRHMLLQRRILTASVIILYSDIYIYHNFYCKALMDVIREEITSNSERVTKK